jgi:hypothetical protein
MDFQFFWSIPFLSVLVIIVPVPDLVPAPLIVDTTNTGFKMSDPSKGEYATFDTRGDGTLAKVSWPKHGSGNAWLAMDNHGDGVIKDGKELFGNFSPHADAGVPNYPNPNGFNALAWYDRPEQGGDANLIIDSRDAIWSKLRLWIDEHCWKEPDVPCRSHPDELHSLESKGITSISLVWDGTDRVDDVGNLFRFYTWLNPEAETTPKNEKGESCCDLHQRSKDPRRVFDVYLKTVQ